LKDLFRVKFVVVGVVGVLVGDVVIGELTIGIVVVAVVGASNHSNVSISRLRGISHCPSWNRMGNSTGNYA